ncbi:putative ATP-dependent RNA helicase dhx33, partial [Bonamia ostreae]
FFTNSQIISAEGRIFNVKEKFLETRETDPVDAAIITILQIHTENNINDDQKFTKNGHILVFFSGQDEIERAKAILKKKITQFPNFCANLRIYPIFSALPTKKQIKVFEKVPKNIRKVILATNIAETSITIDEVEFVVDCGYSKKRFYDFKSGVDVMVNGLITKSEANQRKGRAGRVTNGVCYRLYTEEVYEQMREDIVPEILRTNLSTIIILLKSLGIKKMSELEFIDSPDKDSMNRSCKNLMYLGAISKNGK